MCYSRISDMIFLYQLAQAHPQCSTFSSSSHRNLLTVGSGTFLFITLKSAWQFWWGHSRPQFPNLHSLFSCILWPSFQDPTNFQPLVDIVVIRTSSVSHLNASVQQASY